MSDKGGRAAMVVEDEYDVEFMQSAFAADEASRRSEGWTSAVGVVDVENQLLVKVTTGYPDAYGLSNVYKEEMRASAMGGVAQRERMCPSAHQASHSKGTRAIFFALSNRARDDRRPRTRALSHSAGGDGGLKAAHDVLGIRAATREETAHVGGRGHSLRDDRAGLRIDARLLFDGPEDEFAGRVIRTTSGWAGASGTVAAAAAAPGAGAVGTGVWDEDEGAGGGEHRLHVRHATVVSVGESRLRRDDGGDSGKHRHKERRLSEHMNGVVARGGPHQRRRALEARGGLGGAEYGVGDCLLELGYHRAGIIVAVGERREEAVIGVAVDGVDEDTNLRPPVCDGVGAIEGISSGDTREREQPQFIFSVSQ
ncbi:hypothetical protein DFH09DRAFT_1497327 [Mycena vulgaris]|nr:hypothetical protein DFH09DRAFT_1497327 [Mycena vulgaris]